MKHEVYVFYDEPGYYRDVYVDITEAASFDGLTWRFPVSLDYEQELVYVGDINVSENSSDPFDIAEQLPPDAVMLKFFELCPWAMVLALSFDSEQKSALKVA